MLCNIETWLAGPTPTSTGRRASSLTRRATGASPPAPATRLDLSIKLCEVFTIFGPFPNTAKRFKIKDLAISGVSVARGKV